MIIISKLFKIFKRNSTLKDVNHVINTLYQNLFVVYDSMLSIYDFELNIWVHFDPNIFAILQSRSHCTLMLVFCDIFFWQIISCKNNGYNSSQIRYSDVHDSQYLFMRAFSFIYFYVFWKALEKDIRLNHFFISF